MAIVVQLDYYSVDKCLFLLYGFGQSVKLEMKIRQLALDWFILPLDLKESPALKKILLKGYFKTHLSG